jgi:hypothetical protein
MSRLVGPMPDAGAFFLSCLNAAGLAFIGKFRLECVSCIAHYDLGAGSLYTHRGTPFLGLPPPDLGRCALQTDAPFRASQERRQALLGPGDQSSRTDAAA